MFEIPKQLQDPSFRFVLVKARGKAPFESGWQKGANYPYNHPKIKAHAGNLGILTGNGLIIIDCDVPGAERIARGFPETLIIRTSITPDGFRKKHFYFRCSLQDKKILKDYDQHLGEVQCRGQQVIIPPSIHPSGAKYEILEDRPIAELDERLLLKMISPFIADEKKETKRTETISKEFDPICLEIKKKIKVPDLLKKYGFDTSKNPTKCLWHESQGGQCFSYDDSLWNCFHCGSGGNIFHLVMKHEGVPFTEAKKKLEKLAKIVNIPEEFERKHTAGGDEELTKEEWFKIIEEDYHKIKSCPHEIWIEFLISHGILFIENKDGEERILFSMDGLFKYISNIIFDFKYFTFGDSEYSYYYKDGIYHPLSDSTLKNIMYIILRNRSGKRLISEVIDRIKFTNVVEREEVKPPIDKICVKNGILNLNTKKLEPFNSDIVFFNKMNVSFDPNAKCPEIIKFVDKVLPNGNNRKGFYEWVGYCLTNENPYNKIGFFVGEGENGKSKGIELITVFLGEENCTAVPIHDVASDKHYCRATMYNKKLAHFADISPKALDDMSFIKTMSGEDKIKARTIYGKPFDFKFGGKSLYSANKPPEFSEDNRAIWRRPLIFDFSYIIKAKEKDINIIKKMTTEQELSGLLNMALEGLGVLETNGVFSNDMDIETTRDYYLSKGSATYMFCKKCLKNDPLSFVAISELHEQYFEFISTLNGFVPDTKQKFIEKVQLYTGGLKTTGTKNVKIIRGITLLPNNNKKLPKLPKLPSFTKVPYRATNRSLVKHGNSGNSGNSPRRENKKTDEKYLMSISDATPKIREFCKTDRKESEIVKFIRGLPNGNLFEKSNILKHLEMLKSDGILFEPTPGKLEAV